MRIAALFILASLMSACSDSCTNTELTRLSSPDGLRSAVLFERSCGATSGFATHVSVLRKGQRLSGGGNTFTADAKQGAVVTGSWGGPWAEIAWRSPTSLVVRHADGARTFRRETQVGGVRVDYEQVRNQRP